LSVAPFENGKSLHNSSYTEEGRRKKEEGRRKKEEGRRKKKTGIFRKGFRN
jgi:hypothetical protein